MWNSGARAYDHYEAPGSLPDGVAPKRSIRAGHPLGITPEEAAPLLPISATRIGKGEFPRGTIATTAQSLSGLGFLDLPVPWLIGGAVALLWLMGGSK
ncbi:MAG: hypothetical protein MUQ65_16730 [Armatimonadetes bacterium]|nr:hypothetical protein [Armatimonadota bacterium]